MCITRRNALLRGIQTTTLVVEAVIEGQIVEIFRTCKCNFMLLEANSIVSCLKFAEG